MFKEDENDAINWKEVDKRLKNFPWTNEFNASRKPKGIVNRMGYWKAEEYYKFVFPASEVVFHGLLSDVQKEIWLCLTRMAEFLHNHARNGWLEEDAITFHNMALRYSVLVEEKYGPTICHVCLHNLLHHVEI
ncbi:uncharacterized protein LOC124458302 [Xenia sp. Carnegie-2017]|uniref:uncharacterized protein LOC124458302 n=1 Tax=Xenia sp. Carnegie-2017 TaxID=2897299 RepID=UPI001F040D9C|nr:uncharacterized protein LOC124458302 [Xenia sp. Carnegie-2017]